MASEPDNLILHMLREMRADRANDMRMVADAVARVNRSHEGVNRVLDRLDDVRTDLAAFRAEFTAFRGETDRNARRLEADVATLEGRVWDRQAEAIEAAARIMVAEAALTRMSTEVGDRLAALEKAQAES